MRARPLRLAVTGAAGQVGYGAVFRIAAGEMFGKEQQIELRMAERPDMMRQLEAVAMELEDCNYPLLRSIDITDEPDVVFEGVRWAVLLGAARREKGMERNDLLSANGEIFKVHGRAIASQAAEDVQILVVGNPCNTNCLIARSNAPDVPEDRWFAMMRLDQNRAANHLARRASVGNDEVTNVVVWGNHSSTQYPDALNALIQGRPAFAVIGDDDWLRGEFVRSVAQRGAEIINARGASSAASASKAVLDSVRSVIEPTPDGSWHSLAVVSRGEYGIPEGLQFGFPVRSSGEEWTVVEGLDVDGFARTRLTATVAELESERAAMAHLLP